MKPKYILFFYLIQFFFVSQEMKAQIIEKKGDSISIYHDINDLSKKNKLSRFIYKLIFKESTLKATDLFSLELKKNKFENSKNQNGKIIRNISIETLDPFGYSVSNEKKIPKRKIDNFGNKVHIKTKKL